MTSLEGRGATRAPSALPPLGLVPLFFLPLWLSGCAAAPKTWRPMQTLHLGPSEASHVQQVRPVKVVPTWTAAKGKTATPKEMDTLTTVGPAFFNRKGLRKKKSKGAKKTQSNKRAFSPRGIQYFGGSVLTKPINVYMIWVGTFSEDQKGFVRNFINSLSPQNDTSVTVDNWWAISTQYYAGNVTASVPSGGFVSTSINVAGEYPQPGRPMGRLGISGHVIANVPGVITAAMRWARWKPDPNGIYVVFSDSSYKQAGIPGVPGGGGESCKDYCGWHSNFMYGGKSNLRYSWVGVPTCSGCGFQGYSANGGTFEPPSFDAPLHQAVSTMAHELAETATNPDGLSWFDSKGYENADKCAYRYGSVLKSDLPSGKQAVFNMVGLQGMQYLVQSNYEPVTGKCSTGI